MRSRPPSPLIDYLERQREAARERGDRDGLALVSLRLARVQGAEGDLRAARESVVEGLEALGVHRRDHLRAKLLLALAELGCGTRAEVDAALAMVERLWAGHDAGQGALREVRVWVALRRDDWAGARAAWVALRGWLGGRPGAAAAGHAARCAVAQAALARGAPEVALEVLDEAGAEEGLSAAARLERATLAQAALRERGAPGEALARLAAAADALEAPEVTAMTRALWALMRAEAACEVGVFAQARLKPEETARLSAAPQTGARVALCEARVSAAEGRAGAARRALVVAEGHAAGVEDAQERAGLMGAIGALRVALTGASG